MPTIRMLESNPLVNLEFSAGWGSARRAASWFPGWTTILMWSGISLRYSASLAYWSSMSLMLSSLSWSGNTPMPSTTSPGKIR